MIKFEIIVDHKETSKKCTILPLRGRKDFDIKFFKSNRALDPLKAKFLLHPDGVSLENYIGKTIKASDQPTTVAAFDSIWRRLPKIVEAITGPMPELVKIPSGFVTAYPRKSKDGSDPDGGLATIEALFIAAAFLGTWDETLLDKYYFKNQFLELNMATFEKYGLAKN